METESQRSVTQRVSPKNIPTLFEFSEDVDYRWGLITSELAETHQILEIEYARQTTIGERYNDARLKLNHTVEPLLRHWLNRPKVWSEQLVWQAAIDKHAGRFIDRGQALLERPINMQGYSTEQVVEGFARVANYLSEGLSLREIAARCFLGNSKALDLRQDLLLRLHGSDTDDIKPRPLLLNAWAPAYFDWLLIVENQDSFLRLYEHPSANCALLYSGGFRAGAQRLLGEHTQFSFLPGSDSTYFQQHWPPAKVCFWGDLDYAGMGILRALRQNLPELTAWLPGYQAMLNALVTGAGHTPQQSGKERQSDPISTGCKFSDQELLPAIRSTGRFLDQEGFCIALD